MKNNDYEKFAQALTALSELYSKPVSQGVIALWWQTLEKYDFELVSKAIVAHTQDATSGQYMPKPADIIRGIEGTRTDKAAIAWGKAYDAAQSVGAYTDVVFDDPAIHSAISDLGGWPKFCRLESKDLSYTQHRFCELHRAYTTKPESTYQRILIGDRSPDDEYTRKGLTPPKPSVVGDIEAARIVYKKGNAGGKTLITTQASHIAAKLLSIK